MREIESWYPKDFLLRQGQSLDAVVESLKKIQAELQTRLSDTGDDALYKPIAEGKWSLAETADHLVRANNLFSLALERIKEGLEPLVMPRGRVTDDGRAISPDEEAPIAGRMRTALKDDLEASFARLIKAARQLEEIGKLEHICIHQSFFGPMTGLEAMRLMAWHPRHHLRQIPV